MSASYHGNLGRADGPGAGLGGGFSLALAPATRPLRTSSGRTSPSCRARSQSATITSPGSEKPEIPSPESSGFRNSCSKARSTESEAIRKSSTRSKKTRSQGKSVIKNRFESLFFYPRGADSQTARTRDLRLASGKYREQAREIFKADLLIGEIAQKRFVSNEFE